MPNFKNIMDIYRTKIENALEKFFDAKIKEAGRYTPVAENTVQKLREYTLRKAKRLRPIFVIMGAKAFKDYSVAEENELIRLALAIEFMQSYMLIHDDIIDDSELRRGKPSFHMLYGGKEKEYGIKQAICAGDLADVFGVQSLLGSSIPDHVTVKVIRKLMDILTATVHGEMLDVSFEKRSIMDVTEQEIMKMLELKTAYYTVAGPLQLGALIAQLEESDKNYQALGEFGIKLGLAFQIQDDILGVFGTESELGKPVTSDLEEGKKTLLLKKTLAAIEQGEAKNFLLSSLGHHISPGDFSKIKQYMESVGAVQATRDYANGLIMEAKKILEPLPMKDDVKIFLLDVSHYLLNRDN